MLVTSVESTNCRVYVSVVDNAGGVQTNEVPVNAPNEQSVSCYTIQGPDILTSDGNDCGARGK